MKPSTLLARLAVAALCSRAAADEYTSPEGWSLRFPAGWTRVQRPEGTGARGEPEFALAGPDGAAATVSVEDGDSDLIQADVEDLELLLRRRYGRPGATLDRVNGRALKLGSGTDAFIIEYVFRPKSGTAEYRLTAIALSAGRSYVLSFTAPEQKLAALEPDIRQIMSTFHVPPRTSASTPAFWSRVLLWGLGLAAAGTLVYGAIFGRRPPGAGPAPPGASESPAGSAGQ